MAAQPGEQWADRVVEPQTVVLEEAWASAARERVERRWCHRSGMAAVVRHEERNHCFGELRGRAKRERLGLRRNLLQARVCTSGTQQRCCEVTPASCAPSTGSARSVAGTSCRVRAAGVGAGVGATTREHQDAAVASC